jgi:hypothetical protein
MIAALFFGALISTPAVLLLGVVLGRLEGEARFREIQRTRRRLYWAAFENEKLERCAAKVAKRRKKILRAMDKTLLLSLTPNETVS